MRGDPPWGCGGRERCQTSILPSPRYTLQDGNCDHPHFKDEKTRLAGVG